MHAPSPLRVLHPHHHDIGHVRVRGQRRLDLGREDIRPAGDDHVRSAVVHVQVTVRVEVAHVAERGEVVLGARGLRCPDITREP